MSSIDYFSFFINYIFPSLVFLLGLFGNIFGLITLSNKAMEDIGTKLTFQYMFISDSVFLFPFIILSFVQFNFNINLFILSNLSCKLILYFSYFFEAISPWLIVYISIDRYVSIKYTARRFFLRKSTTQHILFWFVFIVCLIFYVPAALFYEITYETRNNTTVSTPNCIPKDAFSNNLLLYMDSSFRIFIPFILMIVFSVLLSHSLFVSRTRIIQNFLAE